ncbi:MAG TPA: DUF1015 domain-containing protein, partial [Planctomycetota bacterium]|nr:DUF1015 domain-containing protein [Planctomycetota bacterium]
MPRIYPFKGVHYDVARLGGLEKVTTQPYDKINASLQDEYYRRHEHNLIRIILRKDEPGKDKYQEAGRTLDAWLAQGVLVRDAKPALYVYHQTCTTPQGVRIRKGLSALVQVDEPGKGKILPHEQTHTGPKIDRFNLITATKAYTEQVFLLYSDPEKAVNRILDEAATGKPDLETTDDFGETHKVWRIDDPAKIAAVQKILEPKECIIADGHHRYETSWNVKQDRLQKGARLQDPESPANVLATLVNMEDDLTIFGTHRLCYDIADFDLAKLLSSAKEVFDVREYAFSDVRSERAARVRLLEDLAAEGRSKPCFGVAARDAKAHYLFVVRDVKSAAKKVKADRSEDWRSLDVCILHTLILEELLGIGPKQLADEKNVEFLRSADEA